MKSLRVGFTGLLLVCLLTACQSMGLAPAKSFDDRIEYANGALTAVVQTTSQGLDAHTLGVKDAKAVREVAGQARVLLDSAQALGDVPEGQQQLALAVALLQNLQIYLNDRSKP